jgi:hypothetical protein
MRSPRHENRENPAKHSTRIDDSFHRRRHNDREIKLTLMFFIPQGGGRGTDTEPSVGTLWSQTHH